MSSNCGRSATWRCTALTTASPAAAAPGPARRNACAEGRLAEPIAGGVHRVGDAVGVEDDGLSRLERRLGHLVAVVGHDRQRQARDRSAEFLQAAVAAADQRARMAGVDDAQAMLVDVEHDQQERDVQVEHAAVFKLVVELLDHPRRVGVAAEEHPHLGRQLGGQQGRRHALAHDVADGDRPARGGARPLSGRRAEIGMIP